MTYKEWLAEWLEYYVKPAVKSTTYKKYLRQAENHIVPALGGYEPDGLTALVLQRFTVSLTERGLAASTVGGILSVIGSSLKKAVALGLIAAEHTDKVVRPKTRQKKVEAFSLTEQRRIERYICARDGKLFGVLFCLYTGLRIGELLALEWTDLDLERSVLTVSKTCVDSWVNGRYVKITQTPKTETSMRTIPIPKQLLPRLTEQRKRRTCAYFVCGRSEYGSQVRSYQKTFDRLLKKLGIPHRGFHTLRHTFATRALESGMDIKTLSEIMGHKNPSITLARYAHSLFEHKADMMNRLGSLLVE